VAARVRTEWKGSGRTCLREIVSHVVGRCGDEVHVCVVEEF
jgi:hypothetical protein